MNLRIPQFPLLQLSKEICTPEPIDSILKTPINNMAEYEQLPLSEENPPLPEAVSPIESDALSDHQDVSQTWLAYDRAANHMPVSMVSRQECDVPEETRPMNNQSTIAGDLGSSLSRASTITQKEEGREKNAVKLDNDASSETPLWKSISIPSGLVVFGLVLALGHHSVFKFLEGKPVSYSQTWTNRLSNAVALIVKMCWTVAVGLAYQHTLWFNFRRRFIRIQSMDKLLELRSNISGFLNLECFRCAPVAMGIATISWLLPALPVIVPGALSVKIQTDAFGHSFPCNVPTFGQGDKKVVLPQPSFNSSDEISILYVGDPSPQTQKVADGILVGNDITRFSPPCGPNCSY